MPMVHHATLTLRPRGPGLHEITDAVARELSRSGLSRGVATVFCQHTSASLVIMENADPTAQRDLEAWLDRLVPADDPNFAHTLEGPAHILNSSALKKLFLVDRRWEQAVNAGG